MKFSPIILVGLGLLFGESMLSAEIEFAQTRVEHEGTLDEDSFSTEYSFTNTGSEAVTIERVETSCGCTAAALDKKTYEPGESGSIKTTFDYGQRRGRQFKRITVSTDQGHEYELQLIVKIPTRWDLNPRILIWRSPDKLNTKTAELSFSVETPVKIVQLNFDEQFFEVEVKETKPGVVYLLEVTPVSKPEGKTYSPSILVEDKSGKRFDVPFYLRIY